ncbi:MAG: ATP-binding protein [Holdemanella sp.]|nr:ATP-binding protein [Holdemanella sp.]
MKNSFSLVFGKEPIHIINRSMQENEIIEEFLSENPIHQVCMITGVRGSGKTVCLTTLSNEFRDREDWIVIDINPERDILNALAAQLSNRKELFQLFKDAKLNLSLFGIGFEMDAIPPITDIVTALDEMLDKLTKKGKKVLIAIDEVSSSLYIREFISQFQIFIRRKYNVFLLMTGLYENIYELQNEKTLTFLYRAPKVELKPLNTVRMAQIYKTTLNIEDDRALEMAKLTKGYPFAFQVLGYLCMKYNVRYEQILFEFDAYLEEYVYEKIWSELSSKDREVLHAMCLSDGKIVNIRAVGEFSSNTFTVYRNRLIKKGIIRSSKYGYLEYTLPRFEEFILRTFEKD